MQRRTSRRTTRQRKSETAGPASEIEHGRERNIVTQDGGDRRKQQGNVFFAALQKIGFANPFAGQNGKVRRASRKLLPISCMAILHDRRILDGLICARLRPGSVLAQQQSSTERVLLDEGLTRMRGVRGERSLLSSPPRLRASA